MAQAMSIGDPYKRRDVLRRLFNYWIGSDQEAALEALGGLENLALRRDLYREAMRWLAGEDPVEAIALLEKDANLHDHELWGRAFSIWARTDRDEAVKKILAIENRGMREQVLNSVARRLASTDLGGALEWVAGLDDQHRESALEGVLSEAANAHPDVVVKNIEKLPGGRMRREIIARTADEWAERDPDAAIEWARTLDEHEQELAVSEIAGTVFETDPDRAEEIAHLISGSERRGQILGQIARLRATVDVGDAISWLESLPQEDRGGAWSGVAREWARIDPRAAAEYAAATDDSVARGQLVSAVSYSWSQRDPAEAAEWARSLGEDRARENAMNRIIENWARENPAAAGEYVTNSLDGELQANMTRQVVGRWLRENTAEASAWIDTLPDGQARDSAIYTLVSSIEREFPETALQWANTVSDEKKRNYMQRRIGQRLRE
ncbi:MAG: hypothetical protein GWO24_36935 [Akkermansiaceae bacterium]|nr:hypothetical protein [Akkermansiaceae bacterium]